MATINKKKNKTPLVTAGGAKASQITPIQKLRRTVLTTFLWERNAYEDGESVTNRIKKLIPLCDAQDVKNLAITSRKDMKLRHVPLMIVREMARYPEHKKHVSKLIPIVCTRPDQLTELLALYWQNKREPISNQIKKGMANAFPQYDAYQLAKYNRDTDIKLRDVLFLSHAKPQNDEQPKVWKDLIDGNLIPPDTWEVALSSGADKRKTWTRLLTEKKLGYLALLKNIRNIDMAGVDMKLVEDTLVTHRGRSTVLPMRFITAAKHNTTYRDMIEKGLLSSMQAMEKLEGKTVIILDVSGSMNRGLTGKSKLTRFDSACVLGMLTREVCTDARIYVTGGDDWKKEHQTAIIKDARGFKMYENVRRGSDQVGGGGIFLEPVMDFVHKREHDADRVIVLTDEQDCSGQGYNPARANAFGKHNYIINVSNNENGIAYNTKWLHINGHSDAIVKYIQEYEKIL